MHEVHEVGRGLPVLDRVAVAELAVRGRIDRVLKREVGGDIAGLECDGRKGHSSRAVGDGPLPAAHHLCEEILDRVLGCSDPFDAVRPRLFAVRADPFQRERQLREGDGGALDSGPSRKRKRRRPTKSCWASRSWPPGRIR